MDYEQKYNEAIQRAKALLDGEASSPGRKKWIGEIFPELRESEDERIRQFLVELLSSGTWKKEWPFQPNECVAYLEKLKEQPKEELVYRLNGLMQDYIKDGKDEEEREHRLKCYQLFWDALEDAEFFQQKEQKPVEWSKNDTVFLNEITDFFENKTVRLQHDIDMYVHWLKSLPERFNLQPKREWSEEDEKMRNQLIYDVDYHKKVGLISAKQHKATKAFCDVLEECYDEKIAWLKSLRPKRVNVSDQTLQLLICYLYGCHDVAKRDGEKADCRRYISYLENLDYTLKNKWRPSEEQMEALKETISQDCAVCNGDRKWIKPNLESLYEQLKKMKAPKGVPPIESIQK